MVLSRSACDWFGGLLALRAASHIIASGLSLSPLGFPSDSMQLFAFGITMKRTVIGA